MTLSNSQVAAAEDIAAIIAESDAAALTSIEKALDAGNRLIEAKTECRHGEWLPFLERAGVQERKAQRLMKLAGSGLKSGTVSDLGGVKGALEFLSRRDSASKALQCLAPLADLSALSAAERMAILVKQFAAIELFKEATAAMLKCFSPEARAKVEPQATDSAADADDFAVEIKRHINAILQPESVVDRRENAIAGIELCATSDSEAAIEVTLGALMSLGRLEPVDNVLAAATPEALRRLAAA